MQVRGPKGKATRLRDVDGSETSEVFLAHLGPGLTVTDHMTAQRLLCQVRRIRTEYIVLTAVKVPLLGSFRTSMYAHRILQKPKPNMC